VAYTPTGNLRFGGAYTPNGDLLFDAEPGEAGAYVLTLDVTLSRPLLSATGLLVPGAALSGSVTLTRPTLSAAGLLIYDPNVWRGWVTQAAATWRDATPARPLAGLPWAETAPQRARTELAWQDGRPEPAGISLPQRDLPALQQPVDLVWQEGSPRPTQADILWRDLERRDLARGLHWSPGRPLEQANRLGWSYPPRRTGELTAPWRVARPLAVPVTAPWRPAGALSQRRALPWREADLRPGRRRDEGGVTPPGGYQPDGHLVFCRLWDGSGDLIFWAYCGQTASRLVRMQRSYVVRHEISLRRLDDDTDYGRHCTSLSLSLDWDSWAWQLKGTLAGRGLAGLMAGLSGPAPMVELVIDGTAWHFVLDDWDGETAFAARSVALTGLSRPVALSSPYILGRTFTQAAPRTAQQLAADELPLGWTLDWEAADWPVPGGAWTYQDLSPIQAIARIAQAAGAMLVPAKAADTLRVRPRYPVPPWEYATATPDLILPPDVLKRLQPRKTPISQANAVFISGASPGGILGRVYLDGSAGDLLAPAQMDALVTHVDAARAWGTRILSGQATPPSIRSVSYPVGSGALAPPEIGDLIEIGLETPVRGTVSAIEIQIQRSDRDISVTQTLTMGEEVSPWARLQKLLPQSPLLAGTVADTYADGTVLVEYPGGGQARVRGTATEGASVYVRAGLIEGEAPQMEAVDIALAVP